MPTVRPDLVRTLLHNKGWSQDDLADKAGVNAKTVTRMLKGLPCNISTISFVAGALKVEPSAIIDDGTPSPSNGGSNEPRFEVQLVLSIPFEAVKTADGLSDLLRHISKLIDAKGAISVVDVQSGSLHLTIQISEEDLRSLIEAGTKGTFEELCSLHILGDYDAIPEGLAKTFLFPKNSKRETRRACYKKWRAKSRTDPK